MTFPKAAFIKSCTRPCLLLAVALSLAQVPAAVQAISGPRADLPVVRTGAQVPHLMGLMPRKLVAFKYESGWVQIPLQVDERTEVDVGLVRDDPPTGLKVLDYADAGTLVGPDPDPTFDADDELVFMAGDTGGEAPGTTGRPAGVLPSPAPALQAVLTDPDTGTSSYAYVFVSDGSLDPSAGQKDVIYDFHLLSGSYLNAYNFHEGANPEDTAIETPYYRLHFSDRWVRDGLEITAGGAPGIDILDRHKFLFYPGNCGRTEQTFSEGGGGFFANIGGPVRAIRSYLGANSGYATQRDHLFYARRHEIVIFCRVHPIPGAMDFMDYSEGALGMRYFNNANPQGVAIDGIPDTVARGALQCEMVTGAQGTLTIVHSAEIDVGGAFAVTSYYDDEENPQYVQCTGDSHEYGASGPWLVGVIWNTDPLLGPAGNLVLHHVEYFDPPDGDASWAEARLRAEESPLLISTGLWPIPSVPSITGVAAEPNPFRLKVTGAGFRQGCRVEINGGPAPKTAYKNQGLAVAKGAGLKAMVPKGVTVQITVVSPDGTQSTEFPFTR